VQLAFIERLDMHPRLDSPAWGLDFGERGRPGPRARPGETAIITTLRVPKTGGLPTTSVRVVHWLKREGEQVKSREAVVELETEKVTYELESTADGVLLKILAQEGSEVPVGDPVCQIGQPGEAVP